LPQPHPTALLSLIGSALAIVTASAGSARATDRAEPPSLGDSLDTDETDAKPAKTLPPPPPARPEDQEPRPIAARETKPWAERPLEVSLDAGALWLGARGNGASYAPGLAWGGRATIAIVEWFAVEPFFSFSEHAVSASEALDGEALDQPNLELTRLGLSLGPVWVMSPRVRSWFGVSGGWARLVAPSAVTTGPAAARIGERTGVVVHGAASLGTRFDLVPHRVTLSGSVHAGFTTRQSGSAFETAQGIDGEGALRHVAALPELAGMFGALLGVGVVL
jgi:hypothetical protein